MIAGDPITGTSVPAAPSWIRKTTSTVVARLRTNSKLTFEELSASSGIPLDLLRDIEAGLAVPNLRALWSLARVFEVPFRVLIAEREPSCDFNILRADAGRTVTSPDGTFRSRALSSTGDPREPEVYEISLASGSVEHAAAHTIDTYEQLVVVRGRVRVRAGASDTLLRSGDTLFFRSDVPHSYENTGPTDAVAILTMINAGDWVAAS